MPARPVCAGLWWSSASGSDDLEGLGGGGPSDIIDGGAAQLVSLAGGPLRLRLLDCWCRVLALVLPAPPLLLWHAGVSWAATRRACHPATCIEALPPVPCRACPVARAHAPPHIPAPPPPLHRVHPLQRASEGYTSLMLQLQLLEAAAGVPRGAAA